MLFGASLLNKRLLFWSSFFGGFMDRVRHQSWDVVMLGMEWSTGADEAMLRWWRLLRILCFSRCVPVVSLGFVDQWIGSSLQCSSWRTTKETQLWQSLSHEPLISCGVWCFFTKGGCDFVVGFQEVVRSFEVKQFFLCDTVTRAFSPKARIVCVPRVPSTFRHLVASPRNSNCLALIVNVAGTKKMQVPVVLVLCVFDTKSWRPLTLQGKLCRT